MGIKLITSTLFLTVGSIVFGMFFWLKKVRNNRYSMIMVWELGQTLVLIGMATLGQNIRTIDKGNLSAEEKNKSCRCNLIVYSITTSVVGATWAIIFMTAYNPYDSRWADYLHVLTWEVFGTIAAIFLYDGIAVVSKQP